MLAEATLAIVLFTDAANADLRVLRGTIALPGRLLLIGLPLTILLGPAIAWLIFPSPQLLELGLFATILERDATDTCTLSYDRIGVSIGGRHSLACAP